jgi:hypothetical protein
MNQLSKISSYLPKISAKVSLWGEDSVFRVGRFLLAVGIGSPPVYWCSKGSQGSCKCGVLCCQGQNSPEDVTVSSGNTRMSDGMSVFVGFVCLS